MKFIIKIYHIIRHFLNPVQKNLQSKIFKTASNMTMSEFDNWINTFPYLSDRYHGLLDKTASFEHFTDRSVKDGRDCDDFARSWKLWCDVNNYPAYEVIVANNSFPFHPHVVCITKIRNYYYLLDYNHYGPFHTIEDCKEDLCLRWKAYSIDKLIWDENLFQKKSAFQE